MQRKCVIAVDDSEQADRAVAWAAKNVLKPQDEVHVVTVVPPHTVSELVPGDHAFVATRWEHASKEDMQHADDLLERCRRAADAAGIQRLHVAALPGNNPSCAKVGEVLRQYAAQQHADLLVVGQHTLPARGWLAGLRSVSSWCTRNMPCPVVVAK